MSDSNEEMDDVWLGFDRKLIRKWLEEAGSKMWRLPALGESATLQSVEGHA